LREGAGVLVQIIKDGVTGAAVAEAGQALTGVVNGVHFRRIERK
jgi:hypothetical protein